jgi:acetyl-CoA carboxylase carboxyl transferase subunit beta
VPKSAVLFIFAKKLTKTDVMGWFKRLREGIQTRQKKEVPEGLWHQCKVCNKTSTTKDFKENQWVCSGCDHHARIGSEEYFELLFDGKHTPLFDDIISTDVLKFTDLKPYTERLIEAVEKSGLDDAMAVAVGKVHKHDLVIACMDFEFIGGSMGSVVGEKIALAVDYCIEHQTPLMIISKSGGARMMEAAYSLMQMAKTSAKLVQLARAKVPYLSFLTDPTTGGVTASYAMLGDVNFSEPGALIGFAGPRVVKETLKIKKLPQGFQTAEATLENGFLDFIVHRRDLKNKIGDLLYLFSHRTVLADD